jgi:hypothetical protein
MELEYLKTKSVVTNDVESARLTLARQFASELSEGFRAVDYDRDKKLSPLEIKNAAENATTPPLLRDACQYFDYTGDGNPWTKQRISLLLDVTSPLPDARTKWSMDQSNQHIPGSLTGGLILGTLGTIACYTGTRFGAGRSLLIGAAVFGAGAGLSYLMARHLHARDFDRLRSEIKNDNSADPVVRKYMLQGR